MYAKQKKHKTNFNFKMKTFKDETLTRDFLFIGTFVFIKNPCVKNREIY